MSPLPPVRKRHCIFHLRRHQLLIRRPPLLPRPRPRQPWNHTPPPPCTARADPRSRACRAICVAETACCGEADCRWPFFLLYGVWSDPEPLRAWGFFASYRRCLRARRSSARAARRAAAATGANSHGASATMRACVGSVFDSFILCFVLSCILSFMRDLFVLLRAHIPSGHWHDRSAPMRDVAGPHCIDL